MIKGMKKSFFAVQLPDEIIVEILCRLPVKTLLRFKCVSKLWKDIISNPNFSLSGTGRDRVIVGYAPYVKSYPHVSSLYFYSIEDNLSMMKLPDPAGDVLAYHYYCHARFDFFGTCNGLVLFWSDRGMYLWNPLTSCYRILNQLNIMADRIRTSLDWLGGVSGLCYDKTTNDYKALLITNNPPSGGSGSVFVVSLRTGENWTDINFPYKVLAPYSNPSLSSRSGVLVGGHLHWIMERGIGASRLIVYFDEQVNQFREIPMPEEHEYSDASPTIYFGLTLLYGCLCMTKSGSSSYSGDIFIMKEYGVKHSWTKLFNIDGFVVPLHMKIPNEILLATGPGSRVFRYNIQKKYLRRIKCPPADLRQDIRNRMEIETGRKVSVSMFRIAGPFMFTESLASVDLI